MKKLLVLTSIVLGFAVSANAGEMYDACFDNLDYNLKNIEGKTIQFHGLSACIAGKYVFLSGEKDPKIVASTNKSCRCNKQTNAIIIMSD
ncbi:hypothetical protein [Campylobacter helveticus]|uniref:hypothetical protein n=1 Tax=Campylobacter helveticus TaxID=28898 RepID=UPI001112320B|nr:hypothetical protein [Campylobacter helveticus]TNB58611.1 hypothetical protein FDW44_04505 [Campylobacter helveticus]TNB64313.1 hypothetical protein FDW43_02750 [Campylobacter helveticus]TNH34273.1 hypothetical protein FDW46_04285 [Campylobacter helveticus]TNH34413.1 hypothetical protein FDW48_03060 [Campylobacter helveticus]TNH36653.1 hypothetical protein FDW45_04325 [Campylobacter helveticus]